MNHKSKTISGLIERNYMFNGNDPEFELIMRHTQNGMIIVDKISEKEQDDQCNLIINFMDNATIGYVVIPKHGKARNGYVDLLEWFPELEKYYEKINP